MTRSSNCWGVGMRTNGRSLLVTRRLRIAVPALVALSVAGLLAGGVGTPAQAERAAATADRQPIDPQNWENPDDMTWEDYRHVPGTDWANPALTPTVRDFKGALVLLDYPDEEFAVTQPPESTIFGNPQAVASGIPRAQVGKFYEDFLNKPNDLNRGHTINEYWMEDSGGRFGVDLTAFGPYRMPSKSYQYGIDNGFNPGACPAGAPCARNIRTDGRAAWAADVGEAKIREYDFIFYLSAGQDESSTWQEFGEMMFQNKEDVPDAWGPPDPALPNWAKTRYVEWTSWKAASTIWPNAGGGSSTQAESSGQSVYAHEFSHILGIGDNYNNPYGVPLRRAYSGIWGMLSRGTFNGPGGPHSRWQIPPQNGASMGAQHMLRDKLDLGIVDETNVLRLSRQALRNTGVVVARVTARAAPPGGNGIAGINIAMDRDLTRRCVITRDVLCDGFNYNNYTLEVVDRMGSDSFTPDNGVLLAKTKNVDSAPFIWVVDAHPEDIDEVDFYTPDGTPKKLTRGDYRQLSDALFHAGADSGSEYEFVDPDNRLHFYVIDLHRTNEGVLSYTVAVKSTSGSGPQPRGVALGGGAANGTSCAFALSNTGQARTVGGHPEDVNAYLRSDVYRLSAKVTGAGWSTWLPNELATAEVGKSVQVAALATPDASAAATATVQITATSESDKSKQATATCTVAR